MKIFWIVFREVDDGAVSTTAASLHKTQRFKSKPKPFCLDVTRCSLWVLPTDSRNMQLGCLHTLNCPQLCMVVCYVFTVCSLTAGVWYQSPCDHARTKQVKDVWAIIQSNYSLSVLLLYWPLDVLISPLSFCE